MDLYSLPALSVLSDTVSIIEKDALKIVRIISGKARAAIALHGGHVMSYQPSDQPDVIWMSEAAILDGKAAIRGGVPVCWPWFGGLASPSHGFARTSEWQLIEHRENENGVVVCLGLNDSQQTRDIWPHQFELKLYVEVGDQLKITLDMHNPSEVAWPFSAALHTYLNVSDITSVTTSGMGPNYIDKLQDGKTCQGDSELVLSHAIDRIYTQPSASIHVEDKGYERTLKVENQGHNAAVMWNPWEEGASAMADMNDNGYQTMLCVESTVFSPSLESGQLVAAGESHQLITTITPITA
ncbi:D-hexose-6-phosphate mutarotase [Vibrio olivae]|uniref:Putative glucose-6-phosphate 1-epimerase n=1 Tax=Vibrio olivae TaxID=1243002 RepID=A0ABV5HKR4_9VIBR